jgi:predicted GNAT family acetyltransferase
MDVTDNRVEHRFELPTDAGLAVAEYVIEGDTITFTHTVVPREAEGQGVGSRLIAAALADVKGRGLKVVPQCAFVCAWLQRHPEAARARAGRRSSGRAWP